MTVIETMTHSATFNCPGCGTTWFQSFTGCYARLPNGSELLWAEAQADGSYLCTRCGQGFRIWRVGRPVGPHPRQHAERC